MIKIAIISDIHGNMPALNATIKDIDNSFKADEIYCLGDLVDSAPWHNEVIELLRKREIPTVMGNHDERVAFNQETIALKKHSETETLARFKTIEYSKKSITPSNKKYLQQLPQHIKIEREGFNLFMTHGSPKDNREYIFENHNKEALIDWFNQTDSQVIITGHTHYSYIRELERNGLNRLFINAGSVGRSRETIGGRAVYLQLRIDKKKGVQAQLKQIAYDVTETIHEIIKSPIPNFYASFLDKQLKSKGKHT